MLVITAPHFVAAIIFDEHGKLVRCAPILAWMGKRHFTIEQAVAWATRKKYSFVYYLDETSYAGTMERLRNASRHA